MIDDLDLERLDVHTLKQFEKLEQLNRKYPSKLSEEDRKMLELEDEQVDLLDQETLLKVIGAETESPSEFTEALLSRKQEPVFDDNLSIAEVIK